MKISKTAILLCTYNGEHFLKAQLDSYTHQQVPQWELFVHDDGSTDRTPEMIAEYKPGNPVHWLPNNKKLGFVQNFLNAICSAPDYFDAYACSDQDDIWNEDKLSRAMDYLNNIPEHIPAVYGSRTILIDENGNKIGLSRLFDKKPSFKNALMQSIAGGNTMVLNKAARALLLKANKDIKPESHDWFIYQLVTGAGGVFYYDTYPTLQYRQHGGNVIGSNLGLFARLYRMMNLFNGTFKRWNDRNIDALQKNAALLTSENQAILNLLIKSRTEAFPNRFKSFFKLGIYRQQAVDNIALFFAWIFNRI